MRLILLKSYIIFQVCASAYAQSSSPPSQYFLALARGIAKMECGGGASEECVSKRLEGLKQLDNLEGLGEKDWKDIEYVCMYTIRISAFVECAIAEQTAFVKAGGIPVEVSRFHVDVQQALRSGCRLELTRYRDRTNMDGYAYCVQAAAKEWDKAPKFSGLSSDIQYKISRACAPTSPKSYGSCVSTQMREMGLSVTGQTWAQEAAEGFAVAGNAPALEQASRKVSDLTTERAGATSKTHPRAAQEATTQRALEYVAAGTEKSRSPTIGATIKSAASATATRNILLQTAAIESDKSGVVDHVAEFFRSVFVPFLDSGVTVSAINKLLGKASGERGKDTSFTAEQAFNSLRTYLDSIKSEQERSKVIEELANSISSNPAVVATALKRIATEKPNETAANVVMDIMLLVCVSALFIALSKLLYKSLILKSSGRTRS